MYKFIGNNYPNITYTNHKFLVMIGIIAKV